MRVEMHDARRDPQSGRGKFKNRGVGNRDGGSALGKAMCVARGMSGRAMAPTVLGKRCVKDDGFHFDPSVFRLQNMRGRHLHLRDGRTIMMAGMRVGYTGSKHDGQEQGKREQIDKYRPHKSLIRSNICDVKRLRYESSRRSRSGLFHSDC